MWPVPVMLAAAAFTFAGFRVLNAGDGQTRSLREALALLRQPKQATAAARLLRQASRSGSAQARAQASNLLAAFLLEQRGGEATAEAMRLYTTAVRLDRTDDASKFDLELLETLGSRSRRQSGKARTHAAKKAPAPEQQVGGAGARAGGKGY